jgi:hypothetical protein
VASAATGSFFNRFTRKLTIEFQTEDMAGHTRPVRVALAGIRRTTHLRSPVRLGFTHLLRRCPATVMAA